MIRRAVLVAAAAVALILAPSTAMAEYGAADFGFTVSDSTLTIGVPFTVHVTNAEANQAVTLTMTRNPGSTTNPATRSLTKTANAKGVVDFPVTLVEDGTWRLVSTSATGAVLTSQSVTVADKGAVIVAGAGADAGAAAAAAPRAVAGAAPRAVAGAAPGGAPGVAPGVAAGAAPRAAPAAAAGAQLAFTGLQGMGLAVGGGLLVLVGAGSVLVTRRRRSARVPA
jgi:hypothetical protein